MFMPQFAGKVRDGTKIQTIRPKPKRRADTPIPGDIVDCRMWQGEPYRSKQTKLREEEITLVARVSLAEGCLYIGKMELSKVEANRFARQDGFKNFREMQDWFWKTHELPFRGLLISWA